MHCIFTYMWLKFMVNVGGLFGITYICYLLFVWSDLGTVLHDPHPPSDSYGKCSFTANSATCIGDEQWD